MRIRKHDWKAGEVSLAVEGSDDLWTLRTVIQPGDTVKGSTERKVKAGSDEKAAAVRRRVFLAVRVEKVEYAPDGSGLRVLGVITDGPDDVPRGDHHSFALEEGSELSLVKAAWPKYVREKLEQAAKPDAALLVVLFDREEARFFGVTRRGVEELSRLKGDVAKKAVDEKKAANFYREIADQIAQYDARGLYRHIVAGAPAFWKEYVERELPPALKAKTVLTAISDVERTAIRELLVRPEVKKLLHESSTMRELALVEEVLAALGRDRLAYGILGVEEAVAQGSAAAVIITENALAKARADGEQAFARLEEALRACEASRGEVHVLASDEAMRKIDGLGGVAAIRRW